MTRKKVKLAFITNDSSRKATYKKRKKGMLKKIEELSTLCGIEACAIVYGPDDPEPEIWPSDWGVQKVLRKFRTMPELEQSKKMVNQESFIGQRILKSNEQMMKVMKENREKKMTMFMIHCLNEGRVLPDDTMTATDFKDLSSMIEQNLKEISKRLGTLNVNEEVASNEQEMQTISYSYQQQQALAVPKSEEMALMNYEYGGALDMNGNNNNPMMQRHLFMDSLNGNEVETIMPPFGGGANNLQLQSGFWPSLGLLP